MCLSVTLLPVPLRPSRQNPFPSGNVERHVVQHLPVVERLRHPFEANRPARLDRRSLGAGAFIHDAGNMKKINLTSTTLTTMIRMDDRTTLRVSREANAFSALRGGESEIARDRADDHPEDRRLEGRGTKSRNSTSENARSK